MEEQFRIVQDQIEALQASLKVGGLGSRQAAASSQAQPGVAILPPEISQRISRIEERLEYLTQKWLAVDEALFRLGRQGTSS